MSDNPEEYTDGIPRVSNIVSFIFPFEGESKKRYIKWLNINGVDIDEYMDEACDVGTFIHSIMEKKIKGESLSILDGLYELHKKEIDYGLNYIKSLKGDMITEVFIKDSRNRYQGTTDLVRIDEATKTVWLYDWKTWGIAKKEFNLPNPYRKPYDKLKKVSLQLSLYAEYYRKKGYSIGGIYVVWLHETGCYPFELKLYSSKDLNKILRDYGSKGGLNNSNEHESEEG